MPDRKLIQIRQVWHWFLDKQVSFSFAGLAAVVSVFQNF